MKRKYKLILVVGIMLAFFVFNARMIFIFINRFAVSQEHEILTTSIVGENYEASIPVMTPYPSLTRQSETPFITETTMNDESLTEESIEPKDVHYDNSQAMAEITIETDKKTCTFEVMPDVMEETLKDNIGHLPSSVMPGEEGLCVIMGHRDSQFSILKHCEIGDRIIIEAEDKEYVYTVNDIRIVDSVNLLQFYSVAGSSLALVTCYPFWYSGHAPQKIVLYAE